MFSLNSFSDVVAVAKTFGKDALDFAVKNSTLSPDVNRMIHDCMAWSANQTVSIDSFNDGNIEYSIDASYSVEKVAGLYITGLSDITILRTGVGEFYGTAKEAVEKGIISTEQLRTVLSEIALRNEAATVLL